MSYYKPYAAYKDSKVEWLGKVPAHWEVKKLKWLASLQSGDFITGESIEEDGTYPVFGGNGMRGYCEAYTHDGFHALVGRQGALCGNVNYASGKFWASEHAVVVTPYEQTSVRWLGELLRTMNLGQHSISSAQPGLAVERIVDLYLPVPTECERQSIASHIERETARIDALVEKKTRFIELLREKRQALITHAVTKGLNPNVKMKDSGVEWLGDVPEHWKVKPLKLLTRHGTTISYGIVQPGDSLDEGVPFIQTTNMSSGDFSIDSLQKTTPEIAAAFPRSMLAGGEVILGIRATIGAAFVVPDYLAGVNLSRGVARIECSSELTSHYLVAYLRSKSVDGYWQLAKQGSTFNEVSIATVKELLVPVPPVPEQAKLVHFIDASTVRMNTIVSKTERSIELLKERRSALITAAVTGQIDLREAS